MATMQRRIKIIYTGGVALNARVVDADTGELISGVTRIRISITPDRGVTAVLNVYAPLLEIETEAEIYPEQE